MDEIEKKLMHDLEMNKHIAENYSNEAKKSEKLLEQYRRNKSGEKQDERRKRFFGLF